MNAVVCPRYGPPDVLRVEEVEKPSPKEDEVCVSIRSVAVSTEDPVNRRGVPLFARIFTGFTKPKNPILGAEFSGVVDSVGTAVKRFEEGQEVFGATGTTYGCYAEYVCIQEDGFLAKKPSEMTFEESAPVCGALAAWNFLVDKASIKSGQKVLINGASGSVGTAAVQIARHFGAEVTGVCSGANLELVRSLGADEVIDYPRTVFTRTEIKYDIIFDAVGKSSFSLCKPVLASGGVYLATVLGPRILFQMLRTSMIGRKKAKFSATGLLPVPKRLSFLEGLIPLIEAGELKSVIDERHTLEQVSEAHRYVEAGLKKGNVVINIESND